MTQLAALHGIKIARLLALAGAETAVSAPPDELPFDDSGPATHAERWRDLGIQMRTHEQGDDPTLVRLRDKLSLSPLDYWLVMLCAATERYPEVAAALGILMDRTSAHLVTPMAFAQVMHAARGAGVEESLCAALGGGAAARLGLLETSDASDDKPLTHQSIRLSAAELALVFGQGTTSPHNSAAPAKRGRYVPAFDEDLIAAAARLVDQNKMVCLRGPSPRALRQFVTDLGGWLKLEARIVPAGDGEPNLTQLLRLHQALPALDLTGSSAGISKWHAALMEAPRTVSLVVLAGESFPESDIPSLDIPRLGWRESERIWLQATGKAALARSLATRFKVSASEADAACRHGAQVAEAVGKVSRPREELIAAQVLDEGARRMGKLVTLLRSNATVGDLVVPGPLRAQLEDIIGWQRNTARVFGEMGLGRHTPLGRGLTCLFSGAPGTGKTFAAQCLANELGLNLYRIDLSQVVSKYIGETEKALSTVFDEAEAGHGVLLFDEADALFGKRSEVKDAHDRYANIEVGYLLQRIEAFEGVAVLATNLRSNMDPAFVRRIRFMLDFPMPNAAMRQQLWEQSLPKAEFRADGLDLAVFVERFRLSGGSIQNVSLAAAHIAAATPDGRIRMDHLVRATYRELEKAGQSHDRASFGELAVHLPEEVA